MRYLADGVGEGVLSVKRMVFIGSRAARHHGRTQRTTGEGRWRQLGRAVQSPEMAVLPRVERVEACCNDRRRVGRRAKGGGGQLLARRLWDGRGVEVAAGCWLLASAGHQGETTTTTTTTAAELRYTSSHHQRSVSTPGKSVTSRSESRANQRFLCVRE